MLQNRPREKRLHWTSVQPPVSVPGLSVRSWAAGSAVSYQEDDCPGNLEPGLPPTLPAFAVSQLSEFPEIMRNIGSWEKAKQCD